MTVTVIGFDVAGLLVTPGMSDVMIQVTTSPLARDEDVNVGLFVPTFTPSICHWYVGFVPPLVGVAVKVTLLPAHTTLSASLEVIETTAEVADRSWKE